MPSTIERATQTDPKLTTEQVRQAFDVRLIAKRRDEIYATIPDRAEARKALVEGISLDWQGFAWEYGLKKDLRFTPFVNTFSQRVFNNNGELEFRMVAPEDALTGEDMLTSIDPKENRGLVYQASANLRQAFFAADDGDEFLWHSPLDPFTYSFTYRARVQHTLQGKTLVVYNYFNDLNHQQLAKMTNRVTGAQTFSDDAAYDEVATTIVKIPAQETADIWKAMISVSPISQIAGATLEQILASDNPKLLAKVMSHSSAIAEMFVRELESGRLTQSVVGDRLLGFVAQITGQTRDQVYHEIAKNGHSEGSCGAVSFGIHGPMDPVVSEISPAGIKRCKLCKKRLRFDQAYCIDCKFC